MTSTTFVCTLNGGRPKWSRYTLPFNIDGYAQLGDDLYIRAGDYVVKVDPDVDTDSVEGEAVDFTSTVQWAWLDFGQPGVTKQLESFDFVGTGQAPSVQFGYDQRNVSALTTGYALSGDTMPGTPIPFPIAAPTLSVKLTFAGGDAWSVEAMNLYLDDAKGQP